MNLKRYGGKGTLKAVNHINVELNNSVLAMDSSETYSVDKAMIDEDKTHDKARFGANSILVSFNCGSKSCSTVAASAAVSFPWRSGWYYTAGSTYEYN